MAHTRATLDHALMAVASNDQHTVKPWLAARLDYAPPVRDLAALGFPLAGARIDEIDGVQVAVLVYRYREHVVDVFVRPSWLPGDMRLPETVRGFHAVGARGHAMDWLAVSDASPEALASLLESLAAPAGR
jgi:anti-sigma factor RsiW